MSVLTAMYHVPGVAEQSANELGVDISNLPIESNSSNDFFDTIGEGLKNAWYSMTGQTEKTSAYKALMEREDSAYQRMVSDMKAAGLSPYFANGTGSASSSSAGMGQTSGLQLANAFVDILSKKAQIDNTNAQTAHTKADTDSIITKNGFLPDLLQSQLAESNARIELTKSQSAEIAEDIISTVQARSIAMAEHVVNMALKNKDLQWYDRKISTDLNLKGSEIELNKAQAMRSRESLNLLSAQIQNEYEKIAKSVAQRYHLSKEDELLVADLAQRTLQTEVMKYNYDYSVGAGMRTTDQVSKLFGVNLNGLGTSGKNFVEWASQGLTNSIKYIVNKATEAGRKAGGR